ncbi:LytTR family DNA-binding domain-containing protein [Dyadobacter sp. CY323]|uniref:LytR/AlgR family response regulator transcription factor n=1 Tax=Dyadobacter sp. CY323 TaxID=2907302 RepID=UPI001F3C72EC|nr:LytTR family DNA-binding domain-containing protein [Dyadobacter sp. CY323]MCE6991769.1 LytTR family DNA-binding domain-containing protein [Dyadobacter sp. CY323]
MKVLIVDDEPKARTILEHYLVTLVPEIKEIRHASGVEEALGILHKYRPAIVFLDIEMPVRNGFDLLLTLRNPRFETIFTTAFNQYAIQAIRFSALDYLIKPIDPEELLEAINRLSTRQRTRRQKMLLYDNLVFHVEKKDAPQSRLAVASSEGIFFFMTNEIIHLEADRNYTLIYHKGGKPFVASKTLKHFEELLVPFHFIRTHKSHLVNLEHMERFTANQDCIILSDGSKIDVSRRKREEVQQHLNCRKHE